MEGLVASGKIPAGGLLELQDACLKDIEWALDIESTLYVNEIIYKRFMILFFACVYCFSVQGRQNGISSLKYGHRTSLIKHKHTETDVLKTAKTFGFQSVQLDDLYAYKLFLLYINFLRPKVSFINIFPHIPLISSFYI